MWCYIKTENVDDYLNKYPQLSEHWESFVLLRTKQESFLPRQFYKNYPSECLIEYNGKTNVQIENVEFEFKGKLRSEQKKAVKVIEGIYEKNGFINGIIKLPPGTGKTVLSIYLAGKLKLKTCIIVDNNSLFIQWIKAINTFSGLDDENIGIIKQNIFVTNDKMFTVAMSGTLSSKIKKNVQDIFNKINDSKFGLVIYDEVHATSSTDVYSRSSLLFRTKNIIGLSATPYHFDYQKILMENTIGNVIYESFNYEMIPKYYLIHYNSGLSQKYMFVMNKMKEYIQKKSFYNKIIVNSDTYIGLIKEHVQKLYDQNHVIMVVCFTKKQINLISEHLDIIDIPHRIYHGTETEIDKERDKVLIVTYSYCGRGFDMPRLSALILATPLSGKKSLIQVVGRILRKQEGKLDPVVIDFVDVGFPMLSIPEYNRKKKIIKGEFKHCKITEITR